MNRNDRRSNITKLSAEVADLRRKNRQLEADAGVRAAQMAKELVLKHRQDQAAEIERLMDLVVRLRGYDPVTLEKIQV